MSLPPEIPALGNRLSFEGALCTVRYVGTVEGTTGRWLGVEWDDPTRGKHAGEHKGMKYFQCKSKHPTAGSFIRPGRIADKPLGFLEAAHAKYVSDTPITHTASGTGTTAPGPIRFNGKVVEEVGFEKIRKLLAELQELRFVLLDGMCMRGVLADLNAPTSERQAELENIKRTCPKITELDLSRNLLQDWAEVTDICLQLDELKVLKLNGNRFEIIEETRTLDGVSQLSLDETLLTWQEIVKISKLFPSLKILSLSTNQLSGIPIPLTSTITELNLSFNDFESLDALRSLASLPNLDKLSLRGNKISRVYSASSDSGESQNQTNLVFSPTLTSLDISRNQIDSWSFVNSLSRVFPGLSTLRISDNPLYNQPPASSQVTNAPEKPMTVDEAFMLTLARLGNLKILNYSKITPQDRLNGELYYIGLIRKELSLFPADAEQRILSAHPRYRELCEIYELPDLKKKERPDEGEPTFNPLSLAARLVTFTFHMPSSQPDHPPSEFKKDIPRSFDIYRIKAIVSREFNLPPLRFRLIWETDEWDPVEQATAEEDEWDSEEECEGDKRGLPSAGHMFDKERKKFVRREEEFVDSTKEVGFWLRDDIRAVRVRVEPF
ncbi:hypothetical protein VTO42DRAFT_4448 [Malbranchea cinnamomea]